MPADLPVTAPRRPSRVRRTIKAGLRAATIPTSPIRLAPGFLIIGAQRAGTTSLYRYLSEHPGVATVLFEKGVHYFDVNYGRGFAWYRGHFPTLLYARYARSRHGMRTVTGEASPYYLFHPLAAERVARDLPQVKVIVMLRDPVGRAYSHYRHEVDRGFEPLSSFEEALAAEPRRLKGEEERIMADPAYVSHSHQHYSYVSRGHYLEQLQRWRLHFPRGQMLVLKSEEFFAAPEGILRRVQSFLGLPLRPAPAITRHNAGNYPSMHRATQQRLREHFAAPNARLYRYLGLDLGWEG